VHLVRTLDGLVEHTLDSRRLTNLLLTAFAVMAAALAGVGIYGVMSGYVSNRNNEFGIRLALGAQPGDLLRSVLLQGFRLAGTGVVIGIVGALALTRLMTSLLFEVSAIDPIIFTTVALMLIAVALAACYAPARRAMRVDPILAMRRE